MANPLSRPLTTADLIARLGLRDAPMPPGARAAAASAAYSAMSTAQRARVNQAKLDHAAATVNMSALAVNGPRTKLLVQDPPAPRKTRR